MNNILPKPPCPVPVDNWKTRLLSEYLLSKGLTTLPENPYELQDYPQWLRHKGYEPSTVCDALVPLRKLYRAVGLETKDVIRNPKQYFGHRKDPVPPEDMARLLSYADQHCRPRDRTIIYLMCYLGLRDVEPSRMDIGDFYRSGSTWYILIWGKGRAGKDEKYEVCNGLLKVLSEYHENLDRKEGPLFIGSKGARLHPVVISRIVAGIMKKAGVKTVENGKRITPHSIRHAVITKVLEETGDLRMAQKMGRHIDPRTTERYLHDVQRPERTVEWREI